MLLYFLLPNELLSSICEGLSRLTAAATCCKLFSLIVKFYNSVVAAGKAPVGSKEEFKREKHTQAEN